MSPCLASTVGSMVRRVPVSRSLKTLPVGVSVAALQRRYISAGVQNQVSLADGLRERAR
jgi:hypothetical protein